MIQSTTTKKKVSMPVADMFHRSKGYWKLLCRISSIFKNTPASFRCRHHPLHHRSVLPVAHAALGKRVEHQRTNGVRVKVPEIRKVKDLTREDVILCSWSVVSLFRNYALLGMSWKNNPERSLLVQQNLLALKNSWTTWRPLHHKRNVPPISSAK